MPAILSEVRESAVVCAMIGCSSDSLRTKQDLSYPSHVGCLQWLYSQVTLYGMALSLHLGKIPQSLVDFVFAWLVAVAVPCVCCGPIIVLFSPTPVLLKQNWWM